MQRCCDVRREVNVENCFSTRKVCGERYRTNAMSNAATLSAGRIRHNDNRLLITSPVFTCVVLLVERVLTITDSFPVYYTDS